MTKASEPLSTHGQNPALLQLQSTRSRLIPVPRWNDYHVWPPVGGLRHLIFYEKTNGFSECIVRVGRRVLIDEEKFLTWAAKGNHNISQ